MTIRTAKGHLTSSSLATLAAWQREQQGAFPAIEIGSYTVDVDGADTADEMAQLIRSELSDEIRTLADEAALAGDDSLAALALDALDTADVRSVEAVCSAMQTAHDAQD